MRTGNSTQCVLLFSALAVGLSAAGEVILVRGQYRSIGAIALLVAMALIGIAVRIGDKLPRPGKLAFTDPSFHAPTSVPDRESAIRLGGTIAAILLSIGGMAA